jgi:transposase-like protein
MKEKEVNAKKYEIVAEYLTGKESYGALSEKHGVNARTIQTWVRAFRKRGGLPPVSDVGEQDTDIKMLKKQLKQAELKNELLTEMLRLSEEQTGINFRKKFGSGQ